MNRRAFFAAIPAALVTIKQGLATKPAPPTVAGIAPLQAIPGVAVWHGPPFGIIDTNAYTYSRIGSGSWSGCVTTTDGTAAITQTVTHLEAEWGADGW